MADAHELGRRQRTKQLRIAVWTGAGALLLLPLVAMQFSREVQWTLSDFVFFGALLLAVGGAFEFLMRRARTGAYRLASGVALAGAFLLVWSNGAVGLLGSEQNDANLMYGGVLAVGIVGAVMARFQPRGMARALFATALAQVVVPVIALGGGFSSEEPISLLDALGVTAFFTALWVASALSFRRAARG